MVLNRPAWNPTKEARFPDYDKRRFRAVATFLCFTVASSILRHLLSWAGVHLEHSWEQDILFGVIGGGAAIAAQPISAWLVRRYPTTRAVYG